MEREELYYLLSVSNEHYTPKTAVTANRAAQKCTCFFATAKFCLLTLYVFVSKTERQVRENGLKRHTTF